MRVTPILFLFLAFALIASGFAEDSRILGTWQSDQKATLDYLSTKSNISQSILEILKPVLGKMAITYTRDKVIYKNCELAGTYGYRILEASRDYVRLQILGTKGEEGPVSTLYFVGDHGFWSIPDHSKIPNYREMFVKINETKKP